MMLSEFTYTALAVLAFVALAESVVVIFRAKFCTPAALLLVAVLSLYNFGLLLSSLQRLAQRDDLTIGIIPIIAGQVLSVGLLAWLIHDTRCLKRRYGR